MVYIKRLILFTCILLLTACNQVQKGKDSQMALIKATNPTPLMTDNKKSEDRVKDIKKDVSTYPALYDVAVVKGKNSPCTNLRCSG